MRPLFLDFEEDYPGSYNNDYQYMFGEDLLVAPVTEPAMSEWKVYLPGKLLIYTWNNISKIRNTKCEQYFTLFVTLKIDI